jgi:hypothetical protein
MDDNLLQDCAKPGEIPCVRGEEFMTQTTNELKQEFAKRMDLMRTLRDQVRVKLHLAGMDAKQEWLELEPRITEVEKAGDQFAEATHAAALELVYRLSQLRTRLR